MDAGAVSHATFANRTTGNAIFEGPFDVAATGLRQGENVLAVEVHQANSGSSDIVFGSEVQLTTTSPVSFTPSAPNSVRRDLPSLPSIWINEVHPINTTGITDNVGERDPWLELYNDSDADVNLASWSLSDDLAVLGKFNFPVTAMIPARGYLLVWTDGSVSSPPQEVHANFRLSSTGGSVYLSARPGGALTIVDYVRYSAVANQSYGSTTDGRAVGRALLAQSSPGASNSPNPAVGPTILVDRAPSGAPRLTWSSIVGRTYIVEIKPDLRAAGWTGVSQAAGTGGNLTYTEPSLPQTNRFYRVRVN
jgi:hypothetical protein